MSDKARLDGWSFQILAALKEAQLDKAAVVDDPTAGDVRRRLIRYAPTKPEHFVTEGLERLGICGLVVKWTASTPPTYGVTSKGDFLAARLLKLADLWTQEFRETCYARAIVLLVLGFPGDSYRTVQELAEATGLSDSSVRVACKVLETDKKILRSTASKGVGGRKVDQFSLVTVVGQVPPTGTFQMASTVTAAPAVIPPQAWGNDPNVDDILKVMPPFECPESEEILAEEPEPYMHSADSTTVVLEIPNDLYNRLGAVADVLGSPLEDVLLKLAENLVAQTRSSIASDLSRRD